MTTGTSMRERLAWALDKLDECGKQIEFTLGMCRSIADCRRALSEGDTDDHHRFGSPPVPVVNPSEAWCDAYADWYHQGRG